MGIFKVRLIWGLVAGALVLAVMVVGALVILVGGLAGTENQQNSSTSDCVGSGNAVNISADGGSGAGGVDGQMPKADSSGFDAEQIQNAKTIIAVGKQAGVPAYGWVIAIATALQESGLHNLRYGDRDSVGLFQQRPSAGWGSVAQIENPTLSAEAFFGVGAHSHNTGLLQIPGWRKMQVTAAAQAVQRSAFPLAYAQHQEQAQALVAGLAKGVTSADLTPTTTDVSCTIGLAGMSTSVVRPVAVGVGTDLDNYGGSGSHWASIHTGDDLAAPCGTPVQAATSGTIQIKTGGGWAWAGNWLVQVSTGPGALTTWYGHMRKLDVVPGQQVKAGQVIGEVGDLGNATGCHLHFEVHPHGGGYLQDQVDPHVWLQKNLGQTLKSVRQAAALPGAPGGVPSAAPAAVSGPNVRIAHANLKVTMGARKLDADLTRLVALGPDFISINEAQSRSLEEVTPDGYGSYRASAALRAKSQQATSAVVMWRTDRWISVAHGTIQLTKPVTGVRNDNRYASWVTLSSSDGSGRISVISAHAMTDPSGSGRARQAEDQKGFAALAGLARSLQAYGPVIVAGDLNSPYPRSGGNGQWWGPKPLMDRVGMESTFAALGAPPQGWATHDGGGTIDWIFGSRSTITPTSQATFPLNSDHRGVVADFALNTQ